MPALEKAKLQKVRADESETPIGDPVEVQFNPESLSLQLSNEVEGGRSRARQRRQQTGQSSTVLSMDLVFDTADEGTDDAPVSVRTRTALIEQFVVPEEGNPDPPPRLRFQWNDLILTGLVEQLSIEFDLFAANGVPLRAKAGLSIKEQKAEYQFLRGGAGARDSANATSPGEGSASSQPGAGTNDPAPTQPLGDEAAPALEDETPAEFAQRMGLDPAAWRGLSTALSAGLGLAAGVEVGFSASLSASGGIGVSAGVSAGIGVSVEAQLGLDASGGSGTARDAAGRNLAQTGGIGAAIDNAAIASANAAARASAEAFGQSQPASATTNGPAAQAVFTSTAAVSTASTTSASGATSASALRLDRVPQQAQSPLQAASQTPDPRSQSFGFGVPLQPLRDTSATGALTLCAAAVGRQTSEPPRRLSPTTPPWEALPVTDRIRAASDAREAERRKNPCDVLTRSCSCEAP